MSVTWVGENPGLYLKEGPDSSRYSTLASFFRVSWSGLGTGRVCFLLGEPDTPGAETNLCVTDNEPLARWLHSEYASTFGVFKDRSAFAGVRFVQLTEAESLRGGAHTERMAFEGHAIELSWAALGDPYWVELSPDQSPTGKHTLRAVFIDAGTGTVSVDGTVLDGDAQPREFAGRAASTAFLALGESWHSEQ